jgi:hypothetical protein
MIERPLDLGLLPSGKALREFLDPIDVVSAVGGLDDIDPAISLRRDSSPSVRALLKQEDGHHCFEELTGVGTPVDRANGHPPKGTEMDGRPPEG